MIPALLCWAILATFLADTSEECLLAAFSDLGPAPFPLVYRDGTPLTFAGGEPRCSDC